MPADLSRKIGIGKCVLIVLILLYVGMSFLDCTQSIGFYLNEMPDQGPPQSQKYHNNFSWIMVISAALQLGLVYANHLRLQVLPAVVAASSGLLIPVGVMANNKLVQVADFFTGEGMHEMRMLAKGWIVFAFAVLLLVASIFAAVWLNKQKKELCTEEQDPGKREEITV